MKRENCGNPTENVRENIHTVDFLLEGTGCEGIFNASSYHIRNVDASFKEAKFHFVFIFVCEFAEEKKSLMYFQ